MEALNEKELIVSLIKDSLINIKLVTGLNSLGLNADDYSLYLGEIIFSLVGFEKSEYHEMVFEKIYLAMAEKVKDIDVLKSKEKIDTLALEIYNGLLEAKRFEIISKAKKKENN